VGGEQVCVLEAQVVIDGAVESHVGVVLDGRGGTLEAGALGKGGPGGRGEIALPLDAKVVAASPKPAECKAVGRVGYLEQMGGGEMKGQGPSDVV
jgi:hypothetical protein